MLDGELDDYSVAVGRLTKDLRRAASELSDQEAAYLVNGYYSIQELRIIAGNRSKALAKAEKPNLVSNWLYAQMEALEGQIRAALDKYGSSHRLGVWPRSIIGIGPVITAGLLAHTHSDHFSSPSKLWSFAGLNPAMEWKPGERRPFNADLKVLCYKIGESFIKFQNHPDDFYGKYFVKYRTAYRTKNDIGGFAERAADIIKAGRFKKTTEAHKHYTEGVLPPAHIHAMARRKTVKLFLSHYWQVSYEILFNKTPPHVYVEQFLGHVDIIQPPRL